MNFHEYREAVRSVPCPECSAVPGDPCGETNDLVDRVGAPVAYVHDDRSLVYHEAFLGALRAWLGDPRVVAHVPTLLAADLDRLVSDVEDGSARFAAPVTTPAKCSLCQRERTIEGQDAVDYHPAQVLYGQPLGWYSGSDGEVCPGCMALTLARQ